MNLVAIRAAAGGVSVLASMMLQTYRGRWAGTG